MYGLNDDQHKNDGGTYGPRPKHRFNSWSNAECFKRVTCDVDLKPSKLSCPHSAKWNAVPGLT